MRSGASSGPRRSRTWRSSSRATSPPRSRARRSWPTAGSRAGSGSRGCRRAGARGGTAGVWQEPGEAGIRGAHVAIAPRMVTAVTPAKATLRALLGQHATRLGLTASAIDAIVARSQITHWRAGQQIFAADDAHDLVNFLVAGAVKVLCQGRRGVPVLVQIARPGQFFGLASLFDRPGRRQFSAVAHAPAVVAMMSQEVMNGVVAGLPAGRPLQLMAHTWRALSRPPHQECPALTVPLRDRLVPELDVLAPAFGQSRPR